MRIKIIVLLALFVTSCSQSSDTEVPTLTPSEVAPVEQNLTTSGRDLEWWGNPDLPVVGWKTLVGDEGGVIPQKDVRFGTLKLDANAYYPSHRHTAPEIYYILSGNAEWRVGGKKINATPETTIYIPPNTSHSIHDGDGPLIAVWTWWAPNGDRTVFNREGYEFVEPVDTQAPGQNDE